MLNKTGVKGVCFHNRNLLLKIEELEHVRVSALFSTRPTDNTLKSENQDSILHMLKRLADIQEKMALQFFKTTTWIETEVTRWRV